MASYGDLDCHSVCSCSHCQRLHSCRSSEQANLQSEHGKPILSFRFDSMNTSPSFQQSRHKSRHMKKSNVQKYIHQHSDDKHTQRVLRNLHEHSLQHSNRRQKYLLATLFHRHMLLLRYYFLWAELTFAHRKDKKMSPMVRKIFFLWRELTAREIQKSNAIQKLRCVRFYFQLRLMKWRIWRQWTLVTSNYSTKLIYFRKWRKWFHTEQSICLKQRRWIVLKTFVQIWRVEVVLLNKGIRQNNLHHLYLVFHAWKDLGLNRRTRKRQIKEKVKAWKIHRRIQFGLSIFVAWRVTSHKLHQTKNIFERLDYLCSHIYIRHAFRKWLTVYRENVLLLNLLLLLNKSQNQIQCHVLTQWRIKHKNMMKKEKIFLTIVFNRWADCIDGIVQRKRKRTTALSHWARITCLKIIRRWKWIVRLRRNQRFTLDCPNGLADNHRILPSSLTFDLECERENPKGFNNRLLKLKSIPYETSLKQYMIENREENTTTCDAFLESLIYPKTAFKPPTYSGIIINEGYKNQPLTHDMDSINIFKHKSNIKDRTLSTAIYQDDNSLDKTLFYTKTEFSPFDQNEANDYFFSSPLKSSIREKSQYSSPRIPAWISEELRKKDQFNSTNENEHNTIIHDRHTPLHIDTQKTGQNFTSTSLEVYSRDELDSMFESIGNASMPHKQDLIKTKAMNNVAPFIHSTFFHPPDDKTIRCTSPLNITSMSEYKKDNLDQALEIASNITVPTNENSLKKSCSISDEIVPNIENIIIEPANICPSPREDNETKVLLNTTTTDMVNRTATYNLGETGLQAKKIQRDSQHFIQCLENQPNICSSPREDKENTVFGSATDVVDRTAAPNQSETGLQAEKELSGSQNFIQNLENQLQDILNEKESVKKQGKDAYLKWKQSVRSQLTQITQQINNMKSQASISTSTSTVRK